jgi:putative DNA primase/helicase
LIPEFLGAIWGREPLGRFGEIRTIKEGVGVHQTFLPLDGDGANLAADVALGQLESDVYFGVLPRDYASGRNEDVRDLVHVLWADVDAKKVSDVLYIGKSLALFAINAFPIPPQILVDSGGGWHAYWILREPAPYAVAQPVMRWIAKALNGDAVHDKARVLRVPGTINWKREPTPARLIRFDLTRDSRIDDFVGQMPIERERPPVDPAHRIRIDKLPDWLNDILNEGAPKGARSEASFKAILWLIRYGRTFNEIREIFQGTPLGIGAKYAEKPLWDADRWLDYTIRAAEAVA